jgi:N6-L-threonylcarbamoyladenine synthase
MITLGVETSCDDTSICLLKTDQQGLSPEVLAHESFSQEKILAKWGGVVPEIAARNHLEKLQPLIEYVFDAASVKLTEVDLVGVTSYPGLLGPLLTGLNLAKTISLLTKVPVYPVNHLYAHLEAIHLSEEVPYPYLGLVISGGHTLFLKVSGVEQFEILGSTIDDAVGEAFDKGGKLLGLPYPAGRHIDDLAKKGNKKAHSFPIGMEHSKDANFSFSGLKTSLRTWVEKEGKPDAESTNMFDVCASYQEAIVEALRIKTKYAFQKAGNLPLVVGGGVACNSRVRAVLKEYYDNVHIVLPKFCTDNGAMIANYAARCHKLAIPYPDSLKIDARGRFIDKNEVQKAPF